MTGCGDRLQLGVGRVSKTELRQAPECRPGCICHCNKTTCACWDVARLARRDLITRGYPLRDEPTEGN